MNTELSVAIAAVAGLLSFFSPCVLPLVPSYLSFVGGVSYAELSGAQPPRGRIMIRTLLFVLGFSIVFVAFGILFSGSWLLFSGIGRWIDLIAGGVIVLLGLNVIFDFASFLNYEKRAHVQQRPQGYLGAVVVGMAFGAGWSPCIGPILASILFMAGTSGNVGSAALYLAVYSIALGIPFVVTGFAFGTVSRRLQALKKHLTGIRIGSGAFLILMGVLIGLGRFQQLNSILPAWGYRLGDWAVANPTASRVVGSLIPALFALIYPLSRLVPHRKGFGPVGVVVSTLLGLLAAAHAVGVVDLTLWTSGWLTYQGI